jgi:hypothetical protein
MKDPDLLPRVGDSSQASKAMVLVISNSGSSGITILLFRGLVGIKFPVVVGFFIIFFVSLTSNTKKRKEPDV